jgi:hypothetical protein
MTKLLTFPDFVAADPELTPYARDLFARINAQAEIVGAAILATRDPAVLRSRSRDPNTCLWLNEQNRIMADALERDPSGRLAAVPALRAWSYMADIPQMWIGLYAVLLEKHINHLKQPSQIAAE